MIRAFKQEDAAAVQELIYKALEDNNTKDYPPRIIQKIKNYITKEFLIQKSQEDVLVVAEKNNTITGTARLDKNLITNMFVHPEYQNQGFGKELTKHLEDVAKQRNFSFVRLYASLSAITFYNKLGYEQVDVAIHDVFGTNAVMQKRL